MVQPSACRRVASGSDGSSGSSGAGVGARATPQGRDKSSQKKSKGRWMLHEHEQFIVGLGEFGRDWKAIGEIVRTRTAVQIRTHAQKYFQQMEKGRCFPEEPYKSVDGECTADSQAAEPSSSSSGPNPTLSSAPEHGGARTTNRPDHKPSSLSSSLPSSLSSPSSSSASSASLALAAPTAALLAPQFQARVKAEGAPHHPTRRAILTTPAGERGKRLTRPSGPCTVAAVPRATRASSAAAAAAIVAATSATAAATAAAIANPATDGNGTDGATVAESDGPFVGASGDDCDVRHLREGHRGEGGGGDGDDFRGGDGKRRKLDRPPSADIVMAAAAAGAGDGGGMREAMEAAGGSIFAISHPGWLDQRFRGKRSLVSGTSGGLDLAEVEAGAGGYARVGLQVDVDLGGMYSDPPIMLSPTFRKADGGSPPWSMIGNMEEGEAGAAAVISEAGVHGLVGWRSDVGSPSCHKSPLFSDTFLEDFLVGGGAKDSPDSGDDDPPPPPSPPLPPPLCASSSSISCSSSTSSNSSSSLSSISISPSASSFPSEAPSSSCPAAGSREFLSKPYTVGSFSATAAAGTAATAAVTPSNICSPSALPSATGKQQRSTSRAAAATPTSCEGFGYGFAVGPDDCVVARHDSDGGFSLDTMPIPLGGAHHEMASNGILGGSHGSPFPQKQDAPWGVSTAGGDGRVGGYAGGDFDDHAVFAAIHGSGRGGEGGGGGDGATGPSSGTGVGSGASASAGNTGMNPSRQIDFLPFQHQQQSAPSPAGSMLGRAKGAVAAATALSLSEQQAAVVAAAVHDRFAASVGEAARESAALQSSLGGRGGIEDGPLCGNWLSYEDIGDGIGAGQDRLGMEADDAEALETLFAFEDHFGML